jgi:hypothetical protein
MRQNEDRDGIQRVLGQEPVAWIDGFWKMLLRSLIQSG